jgi:hypothetical protein
MADEIPGVDPARMALTDVMSGTAPSALFEMTEILGLLGAALGPISTAEYSSALSA